MRKSVAVFERLAAHSDASILPPGQVVFVRALHAHPAFQGRIFYVMGVGNG